MLQPVKMVMPSVSTGFVRSDFTVYGSGADSFVIDYGENKIFAFGQAIPAASNGVLRSTSHGSHREPDAKIALYGLAASSGVLNPRRIKRTSSIAMGWMVY